MVDHLFKNFLLNLEEYKASVEFWRDLCDRVLIKNPKTKIKTENEWQIWLNTCFLDGTPFLDGNPIYSLISADRTKGICIIQEKPTAKKTKITAWMDKFGDIDEEDSFVQQLIIVCELSRESAQLASELIKAWVKKDVTYNEMEKLIKKTIYLPGYFKS